MTEKENERERETLLDNRFQVIEEIEDQSDYTQDCHKLFWRCLIGNFQYRLKRVLTADPEVGNSVSNIDMVSRFLFPSTFIILNVLYWYIYLTFETNPPFNKNEIPT